MTYGYVVPLREQNEWSAEEVGQAKALKAAGFKKVEIAKKLGRTPGSVRCFFRREKVKEARGGDYVPENAWTPEQAALAKKLHAEGKNYSEIGRAVGRSSLSAKRFLKRATDPAYRAKENARKRAYEKEQRELRAKEAKKPIERVRYCRVPAESIAAYEARCREPMTLTQRLMGDPEPSRSALNQRKAA